MAIKKPIKKASSKRAKTRVKRRNKITLISVFVTLFLIVRAYICFRRGRYIWCAFFVALAVANQSFGIYAYHNPDLELFTCLYSFLVVSLMCLCQVIIAFANIFNPKFAKKLI